jgi:hypothetical protein
VLAISVFSDRGIAISNGKAKLWARTFKHLKKISLEYLLRLQELISLVLTFEDLNLLSTILLITLSSRHLKEYFLIWTESF